MKTKFDSSSSLSSDFDFRVYDAHFLSSSSSCYQETSAIAEHTLMLKQIEHLRELRKDWDGHGAARVCESSLSNANTVAQAALSERCPVGLPVVSPNPNGTVSLEWEYEDSEAYLEIGNSRVTGYIRSKDSPAVYLQGSVAEIALIAPAMLALLYEPSRPFAPTISTLDYHSAVHV